MFKTTKRAYYYSLESPPKPTNPICICYQDSLGRSLAYCCLRHVSFRIHTSSDPFLVDCMTCFRVRPLDCGLLPHQLGYPMSWKHPFTSYLVLLYHVWSKSLWGKFSMSAILLWWSSYTNNELSYKKISNRKGKHYFTKICTSTLCKLHTHVVVIYYNNKKMVK